MLSASKNLRICFKWLHIPNNVFRNPQAKKSWPGILTINFLWFPGLLQTFVDTTFLCSSNLQPWGACFLSLENTNTFHIFQKHLSLPLASLISDVTTSDELRSLLLCPLYKTQLISKSMWCNYISFFLSPFKSLCKNTLAVLSSLCPIHYDNVWN